MAIAYETEKIEFKSDVLEDIYKEIIAFANTGGGTLYIGISDSGEVATLPDIDDTYIRITSGIRDAIAPNVTAFVKYLVADNKVIHIEIDEDSCSYKPYYLKSEGMKPSGVCLRQGSSSVQESPEQIRQHNH